jgi:hypothetical protein
MNYPKVIVNPLLQLKPEPKAELIHLPNLYQAKTNTGKEFSFKQPFKKY